MIQDKANVWMANASYVSPLAWSSALRVQCPLSMWISKSSSTSDHQSSNSHGKCIRSRGLEVGRSCVLKVIAIRAVTLRLLFAVYHLCLIIMFTPAETSCESSTVLSRRLAIRCVIINCESKEEGESVARYVAESHFPTTQFADNRRQAISKG